MQLTKDILKAAVAAHEVKIKKKMNQLEVESFVRHVKELSPQLVTEYANMDPGMGPLYSFISNTYASRMKEAKAFDIKEMMKVQMDAAPDPEKFRIENFSGADLANDVDSLKLLTRVVNRDSLMRDVNILIDSRYQNQSNQNRSRISFNIVAETRNKSEGSGTIIANAHLKEVVEIEVYPFSIPYFTDADNYYKKITMSILELSASSIDAYENSQFHFIFDIEKRFNLLYLTPINKVFKFHKPIARINELTLRFGSPLAPIEFEKDRLRTKNIDYNSNPMTIEFFETHNLISGDLIYFNDFATLDDTRNIAIINEVTTPKGHTCSRIDSVTISINVDASRVIAPDTSRNFLIYLGSKRIMIPMRIRYLEN